MMLTILVGSIQMSQFLKIFIGKALDRFADPKIILEQAYQEIQSELTKLRQTLLKALRQSKDGGRGQHERLREELLEFEEASGKMYLRKLILTTCNQPEIMKQLAAHYAALAGALSARGATVRRLQKQEEVNTGAQQVRDLEDQLRCQAEEVAGLESRFDDLEINALAMFKQKVLKHIEPSDKLGEAAGRELLEKFVTVRIKFEKICRKNSEMATSWQERALSAEDAGNQSLAREARRFERRYSDFISRVDTVLQLYGDLIAKMKS